MSTAPLISYTLYSSGGASDKEPALQSRNPRDMDSICGSGRSPGRGHGNPLLYSYWKIPWTEEPGGLQCIGLHRVGHD